MNDDLKKEAVKQFFDIGGGVNIAVAWVNANAAKLPENSVTKKTADAWLHKLPQLLEEYIDRATLAERKRIMELLPNKKKPGSDGQKHNGWNNAVRAMHKAIATAIEKGEV